MAIVYRGKRFSGYNKPKRTPSHPKKSHRQGVGDLGGAVTFAGVTFRPGEYVYADNNGVIVSPSPLKMPE